MPRHLFQQSLDIRLLHEAEAHLHGDDAASLVVAVEDGDAIAIIPDVGDLGVGDFHEDQVPRQDAVALPQHLDDRRRAIGRQPQLARRHDDGVAFHENLAAAMELDQFRHRHRRLRGIGGKRCLAAPAPGRHHQKQDGADRKRDEPALQELEHARDQEGEVDRQQRAPHQAGFGRSPFPVEPGDRNHRQRGDNHDAGHGQPIGRRQRRARAERDDEQDAADKKRPIDKRDIDLTGVRLMGVQEIEPRKQAQSDRL